MSKIEFTYVDDGFCRACGSPMPCSSHSVFSAKEIKEAEEVRAVIDKAVESLKAVDPQDNAPLIDENQRIAERLAERLRYFPEGSWETRSVECIAAALKAKDDAATEAINAMQANLDAALAMADKKDVEINRLENLCREYAGWIEAAFGMANTLEKINLISHGLPRDDQGAGPYYQARLSIAQDMAIKAVDVWKAARDED